MLDFSNKKAKCTWLFLNNTDDIKHTKVMDKKLF